MCVVYTRLWAKIQECVFYIQECGSKYKNVCYIYKSVGQNTKVCVIKQDCVSKYKNVCYIYRGVGKQTKCVLYIQDCG